MTNNERPTRKTRDRFIDYGKAIIIFEVAINHVGAPFWNNPSVYMLFFFFVVGYVHNDRRPIADAIKRNDKHPAHPAGGKEAQPHTIEAARPKATR